MAYTKQDQLKKMTRKHRVCSRCGTKRLIKFYSKPTAIICNTCKIKSKRVKKESSKTYITKKLDAKWSLEVKKKAGFKCEFSGKTDFLNSHHIFSRSNRTVRHDLDNGVCLSSGHHTLSSEFSAHKTPVEYIEWIKEYRGLAWYKRLRRKARAIKV